MLVMAGLLLVACGVEPVRMMPGDICTRCRKTISDTRIAAELIDQAGRAYKFHSTGCMAKYLKAHPEEQSGTLFATDYGTGRLVTVKSVKFVATPIDRDVDYEAYYTDAGANDAASRGKTTPVEWQKVLADAPAQ
jgi:copper chaperone NosL